MLFARQCWSVLCGLWLAGLAVVFGLPLGLAPGLAPVMAEESRPQASEHVTARLVSDVNAVAPGQSFAIALHQAMRGNWHTYWRNPGDSGEATDIAWSTDPGVDIGPLIWPTPEPYSLKDPSTGAPILTDYVHKTEALFLAPVTVSEDVVPGSTITITADVMWLECDDICIPVEGIVLSLELPVIAGQMADRGAPDPKWASPIAQALAKAPQPVPVAAGLSRAKDGNADGDAVVLAIADQILADPIGAGALRNAYFFPYARDVIDHNAPQPVTFGEAGLSLVVSPGPAWAEELSPVSGVLAYEQRTSAGWMAKAMEIYVDVGRVDIGAPVANTGGAGAQSAGLAAPTVSSGSSGSSGSSSGTRSGGLSLAGLFTLLGAALLGGLVLNLMPCVFPVLSLKAAGFVTKAHDQAHIIRRHGLLFLAGVLASFGVMAVVLAIVQTLVGGGAVYGAWLQNPLLVTALAIVMFLVGLNLLGVFELGTSLQSLGAGLAGKGDDAGAFFTGVLAVVVGAPCIGPFLGPALGLAFNQSPPVLVLFMLTMGLGLAAPFVALSFSPKLLALLPKPGAWMETTKQVLAFPMFLTAVWLVWTVSGQLGADGAGLALLALVAVGFVVWALVTLKPGSASRWMAASAGGLALAGIATGLAGAGGEPRVDVIEADWSPQAVGEWQAKGHPVFVDFTASWCVTCQLNKFTTLNKPAVRQAFSDHNVVFLTADWTARDSVIAAELERYGRAGVPLYLYYSVNDDQGEASSAPARGAQILPQTLSPGLVIDIVEAG